MGRSDAVKELDGDAMDKWTPVRPIIGVNDDGSLEILDSWGSGPTITASKTAKAAVGIGAAATDHLTEIKMMTELQFWQAVQLIAIGVTIYATFEKHRQKMK